MCHVSQPHNRNLRVFGGKRRTGEWESGGWRRDADTRTTANRRVGRVRKCGKTDKRRSEKHREEDRRWAVQGEKPKLVFFFLLPEPGNSILQFGEWERKSRGRRWKIERVWPKNSRNFCSSSEEAELNFRTSRKFSWWLKIEMNFKKKELVFKKDYFCVFNNSENQ